MTVRTSGPPDLNGSSWLHQGTGGTFSSPASASCGVWACAVGIFVGL